MLTEKQLKTVLQVFETRQRAINTRYLRTIGDHLRTIGTLTASDVSRLVEMRRVGANLTSIKQELACVMQVNIRDVTAAFRSTAEIDVRMMSDIFGRKYSPNMLKNDTLKRILSAQAAVTAGALVNLSNTTVVGAAYQNAVDSAIQAVQSGVTDYREAIRTAYRQVAAQGLVVGSSPAVRYASGVTRRLDTAVRQNVLDGVRAVDREVNVQIGREFGATGYEISAHALCAADHVLYQGGQYSLAAFDQLQDRLEADPHSRRIGAYNCKHGIKPIILGISKPSYSADSLREFEQYSAEQITVNGRTRSRYEWTQEQRRIETSIRRAEDTRTIAEAIGDDVEISSQDRKIEIYQGAYKALSGAIGVSPKWNRTIAGGG